VNKEAVVEQLLTHKSRVAKKAQGTYFAPSNIALCKYWGKRDTVLNLPQTSSLSVSLGHLGATTVIQPSTEKQDAIWINGKREPEDTTFFKNLSQFLNLFRFTKAMRYHVKTESNIPIGAGLASSAAGFAAVVGALNDLYDWQLALGDLSILGRLGSGSASRSFWPGFVEWRAGVRADGLDSQGLPLLERWPDLRIGILMVNTNMKPISSRVAMERTVLSSPFYAAWPEKQAKDLHQLKAAIAVQDFVAFGRIAENNALAMHSLMLTAIPPILYAEPATIAAMHQIWQHRSNGLSLYFTQDAGPNLKLLFLEKDTLMVKQLFPNLQIIAPFTEEVVLVDENDVVIGTTEKIKAHEEALLHRAFSVFVYRRTEKGLEILLQKRQQDKYHCGGLWTNTCCSHPRIHEDIVRAGERRLFEEMALSLPLKPIGKFLYKAVFSNGLTEHEYDHVLLGEFDDSQTIKFDPLEVEDYQWLSIPDLEEALAKDPLQFTPWFKTAFQFVLENLCCNS